MLRSATPPPPLRPGVPRHVSTGGGGSLRLPCSAGSVRLPSARPAPQTVQVPQSMPVSQIAPQPLAAPSAVPMSQGFPQAVAKPNLMPLSPRFPQPLAAPTSLPVSLSATRAMTSPSQLPGQQMLHLSANSQDQRMMQGGTITSPSQQLPGQQMVHLSANLQDQRMMPGVQKVKTIGEGAAEWYKRYSQQADASTAISNQNVESPLQRGISCEDGASDWYRRYMQQAEASTPTNNQQVESQLQRVASCEDSASECHKTTNQNAGLNAQALCMMSQAQKNAEAEIAAAQSRLKSQHQEPAKQYSGPTGPEFPFTLVCVEAPGAAVDVNMLPVEARSIGIREDVDTQVGKTLQVQLFLGIFADRPALAWVSRIHCDFSPVVDSPGKFTVTCRSPNGIRVNEKYVSKGEAAKVRPPVIIDFLTTLDAGRTFELLCRWQFEPSHRIPWGCSGFAGGVQPQGPPPPMGEVAPLPQEVQEIGAPLQGQPAPPTYAAPPCVMPYSPGERIEAYYQNDGRWYGAIVESMQADGTFVIAWDDQAQLDRLKRPEQVRRPNGQAITNFSGSYVDTFKEKRRLTQLGNQGECDAGWKFVVSGDTASIVGQGITGKFRDSTSRVIDWSNGIIYIPDEGERPRQPDIMQPPVVPQFSSGVPAEMMNRSMSMEQTVVRQEAEMVPVPQPALGEVTACPFWIELGGSVVREDYPPDRRKLIGHHSGITVGRLHQGHIFLEAFRDDIRDDLMKFISRDHFRIIRCPDSTYRLERLTGNSMWRVRPGERVTVRKGDDPLPLAGGDIILFYSGAADGSPDGPGNLGTLFFNFCDAHESAVTMGTRDALVATGGSCLSGYGDMVVPEYRVPPHPFPQGYGDMVVPECRVPPHPFPQGQPPPHLQHSPRQHESMPMFHGGHNTPPAPYFSGEHIGTQLGTGMILPQSANTVPVGTGTMMPHTAQSLPHSNGTDCRTPLATDAGFHGPPMAMYEPGMSMYGGPATMGTGQLTPRGGQMVAPGTPPRGARNHMSDRRRDPIEDGPIDSMALQMSHASAYDSFGYGRMQPPSPHPDLPYDPYGQMLPSQYPDERAQRNSYGVGALRPFGLDEWRAVDSSDELGRTSRPASPPLSMRSLPRAMGTDHFSKSGFRYS